MEELIQELITTMQCGREEAEIALEKAGGDRDAAVKLLRRTIFALKGKLRSSLRKIYCIFIIYIDTESLQVIRSHITASRAAWIYNNTDISQTALSFEDYIYSSEFKAEIVPGLTKDLNNVLADNLKGNFLNDLIDYVARDNMPELNDYFKRILGGEIADREIDLFVEVEKLNKVSFEKLRKKEDEMKEKAEKEQATKDEEEKPKAKEEILILKTDIIVAPVRGIPVDKLKIGDKIFVKITDNSPQARYVANLLKGEDDILKPVTVPVVEITPTDSGRVSILTKFGPGIFGKVVVQGDLKIKTEITEGDSRANTGAPDEPGSYFAFFIIIGIAFFIGFIVLVSYLFLR